MPIPNRLIGCSPLAKGLLGSSWNSSIYIYMAYVICVYMFVYMYIYYILYSNVNLKVDIIVIILINIRD